MSQRPFTTILVAALLCAAMVPLPPVIGIAAFSVFAVIVRFHPDQTLPKAWLVYGALGGSCLFFAAAFVVAYQNHELPMALYGLQPDKWVRIAFRFAFPVGGFAGSLVGYFTAMLIRRAHPRAVTIGTVAGLPSFDDNGRLRRLAAPVVTRSVHQVSIRRRRLLPRGLSPTAHNWRRCRYIDGCDCFTLMSWSTCTQKRDITTRCNGLAGIVLRCSWPVDREPLIGNVRRRKEVSLRQSILRGQGVHPDGDCQRVGWRADRGASARVVLGHRARGALRAGRVRCNHLVGEPSGTKRCT
jgi:hypothetical protein